MMLKVYAVALLAALAVACTSLPPYDAAFTEVDQNRDDIIEWREFKTRFRDADPKAFLEADRNKNGEITPEEWRLFVESQSP